MKKKWFGLNLLTEDELKDKRPLKNMKNKFTCEYYPLKGYAPDDATGYNLKYDCPVHFPERNCEHDWQCGGTSKDGFGVNSYFTIFCKKCGKIKTEKVL